MSEVLDAPVTPDPLAIDLRQRFGRRADHVATIRPCSMPAGSWNTSAPNWRNSIAASRT